VKAIGASPKEAAKTGEPYYCGRIYGEATSVKTKEKKNGDMYSYLVGEFRGIGPDGKKFESMKLFLPGGIFEQVESSLTSTGKPVTFGFDIFAQPDDGVAFGYRYGYRSILKTEASSRLEAMSVALADKEVPKAPPKKKEAK
jgi:hypothetical protein